MEILKISEIFGKFREIHIRKTPKDEIHICNKKSLAIKKYIFEIHICTTLAAYNRKVSQIGASREGKRAYV